MATTTTQILFNSPALHSLKRDQLVKLCKIHSIKANGKNTELIERLKQRALELPPEALNAAESEEEDDDAMDVELPGSMPMDDSDQTQNSQGDDYDMQDVVLTSRFTIPRPSEQWEVVMEDIQEVDEGTVSSKNSMKTVSNGEFGTQTSKSSVSSSIRALATSLGIKRVTSKGSYAPQDTTSPYPDPETGKMPSLSPGKLFGSLKARDSLAEHATPYANIPPSDTLPDTDHFKFSTPDASILATDNEDDDVNDDSKSAAGRSPLPKPALRLAGGVKSTIRLVSHPSAPRAVDSYTYMSPPRLPVVQTDFDIAMGTPGTLRTFSMWPASPRTVDPPTSPRLEEENEERLYPKLPLDDEDDGGMPGGVGLSTATPARTKSTGSTSTSTFSTKKNASTPGPIDEPDMFSPTKPTANTNNDAPAPSTLAGVGRAPPRTTPFLFGSPLPRRSPIKAASTSAGVTQAEAMASAGVSNAAFDGVAKSVLEEMHRRLAEANTQNGDAPATTHKQPLPLPMFGGPIFGPTVGAGSGAGTGAPDRFAKAHEAEFSKMQSITTHYAARRPVKRKSDALGHGAAVGAAGQKRRSSAAAGARVISAGARRRSAKRGVPGGFGSEDDDEGGEDNDDGEGEGNADARDEEEDAGARRSSKRMRITEGWDVHRGQRVSLAPPLPPADEERKMKERDAVKRELDAAKARRRSSRGRPSIGVPPAKAKSRFGFFASAKSIVKNVWNMGGSNKTKSNAATVNAPPSSIPVPKATYLPVPPMDKKAEKPKGDAGTDAAAKHTSSTVAAANARKVSGSHSRVPSFSSTSNRFLKPSGSGPDAKTTGTLGSTKSTNSRARSPIPSFNASSGTVKSTATANSAAGTARSRISSTGTTAGTATSRTTARTSTVSSMGTRTSMTSGIAVSSIGTRRSVASTNTLASTSSSRADAKSPAATSDTNNQPGLRKRTSSLLAPTASSLAKTNPARQSTSGRTSGLPAVAEVQKHMPKRGSIHTTSKTASTIAAAHSPMSPRPTRIFSQPLTNFSTHSPASSSASFSPTATPAHHASLTAAAASIMTSHAQAYDHMNMDTTGGGAGPSPDAASSPSKIPRPAVLPPKPKQLVARKPRISRSRVIAKLGAQRAAAAQGTTLASPSGRATAGTRTRSSVGARRSFGGVKGARASAGAEIMRSAVKKRARQSEYMRRRSRVGDENESAAGDE